MTFSTQDLTNAKTILTDLIGIIVDIKEGASGESGDGAGPDEGKISERLGKVVADAVRLFSGENPDEQGLSAEVGGWVTDVAEALSNLIGSSRTGGEGAPSPSSEDVSKTVGELVDRGVKLFGGPTEGEPKQQGGDVPKGQAGTTQVGASPVKAGCNCCGSDGRKWRLVVNANSHNNSNLGNDSNNIDSRNNSNDHRHHFGNNFHGNERTHVETSTEAAKADKSTRTRNQNCCCCCGEKVAEPKESAGLPAPWNVLCAPWTAISKVFPRAIEVIVNINSYNNCNNNNRRENINQHGNGNDYRHHFANDHHGQPYEYRETSSQSYSAETLEETVNDCCECAPHDSSKHEGEPPPSSPLI